MELGRLSALLRQIVHSSEPEGRQGATKTLSPFTCQAQRPDMSEEGV